MKPNLNFLDKDLNFWANVRTLSEKIGYTKRGRNTVLKFTEDDIKKSVESINLKKENYFRLDNSPTKLTMEIISYIDYRADILNKFISKKLLDISTSEKLFNRLKSRYQPQCPIPMNKQKGNKKTKAFFTGMINMLIEANLKGCKVDYNPKKLTKILKEGDLIHTLSRRADGVFPSVISPIAIWEIKEYYYTTTFGSRVADAVYETLLDGFELEEADHSRNIKIFHYLFLDGYFTWWEKGRSYLCRTIDMMHMGKVDEVIFGKEILEDVPRICKEWLQVFNGLQKK